MKSHNHNHSRNYNRDSCNKCSVCHNPEPACSCHYKHQDTEVPVKITQFNCEGSYLQDQCVEFNGKYYISTIDGNDVEPSHGTKFSPPIWLGPFSLCELIRVNADGEQGPQGVEGVQGPRGETGNTGPQGVSGPQGPQGIEGVQGSTGNTGPQGIEGIQGGQGEQGDFGPQGTEGPDGEQGVQGPQGQTGIPGPQGVDGEQGVQGPQGDDGVQGAQGVDGEQGIAGVQGETGVDGQDGPQGLSGQDGAQGSQGVKGDPYEPANEVAGIANYTCPATGTTSVLDTLTGMIYFCTDGQLSPGTSFGEGPQGQEGSQGVAGQDGAQGAVGQRGEQGSQGQAGIQGQRGEQGQRGLQGEQGPQGIQGQRGEQGQRGLQGEQGVQGLQGQRGLAGPRGSQGEAGVQGIQGQRGIQGVKGEQGLQGQRGVQGPQGVDGRDGPQGEIGEGVQGPAGVQGPQGEFGGPVGPQGVQGSQGVQGPAGKDYDPNCQAAVVVDVLCANTKGNITLVFEEVDSTQDTQEMPVAVFKPTNRDLLSAIEETNPTTNEKFWTTVNHIDAKITWNRKPTVGMSFILSDFKAGEMTDFNKQAIRFDVIDLNGGCLGFGIWELLIECNNCNCVIPTLHVECDATGKECAIWNDGKGNIVKLALCNNSSCGTIDQYPGCDPLLAKKWEESCTEGVDIGYYTYKDGYWLNTENGNSTSPDSMENWYGPFGTYELIQTHIETVVNDRVAMIVDEILTMRGLV